MTKEIFVLEKLGSSWYSIGQAFTVGKIRGFIKTLNRTGDVRYLNNSNDVITEKEWFADDESWNLLYTEGAYITYYRLEKMNLNDNYYQG